MGRDASGRLKSAYSATEISYNIEKKSCCKMCCLCFVSLPHGAVGLSGVCHRGIFQPYSLYDYFTFQLTKIKALIRMQGCAGCSVPSFFACN